MGECFSDVRWGFHGGRFFLMGTEYGLENVNGKMKKRCRHELDPRRRKRTTSSATVTWRRTINFSNSKG